MKFSSYFIDRPVFASVLSAFILIAGAIALFKLPVSEYPEVVPPSVVVREGLKVDDVILVKGLQQVRPGMPVTPQLVAMGEPHRGGNTLVAQN